MPNWLAFQTAVEVITHDVMRRDATVTPTTGAPFAIKGVLTEETLARTLIDEVGHHDTDNVFEARKASDIGPFDVSMFPRQGNLYGSVEFEQGAIHDIFWVYDSQTLLYLGLSSPR